MLLLLLPLLLARHFEAHLVLSCFQKFGSLCFFSFFSPCSPPWARQCCSPELSGQCNNCLDSRRPIGRLVCSDFEGGSLFHLLVEEVLDLLLVHLHLHHVPLLALLKFSEEEDGKRRRPLSSPIQTNKHKQTKKQTNKHTQTVKQKQTQTNR